MKLVLRLGTVLLASLGICFAGDGPTFKEGKWSFTSIIKMDGNSAQAAEMQEAMKELENMPPAAREMMKKMQGSIGTQEGGIKTTATQCITNNNPVPDMNAGKKNTCRETHQIRGNTVTFHSVCKEPDGQVEVDGEMTFTEDTMKGQIKSHQLREGEAVDTTIEMSGKYLGPCK